MNNKSMKIMEYTMPVMILYFTYIMNSALGLYWIYRSVTAILQTIILAKVYPIPAISDEEMKLAEQQYGGVRKKKKKKKPAVISDISEIGDGQEEDGRSEEDNEEPEDSGDDVPQDEPEDNNDDEPEKPVRKNEVKKNYHKTGNKQYKVKRRKK
jgi:hypothetical protein